MVLLGVEIIRHFLAWVRFAFHTVAPLASYRCCIETVLNRRVFQAKPCLEGVCLGNFHLPPEQGSGDGEGLPWAKPLVWKGFVEGSAGCVTPDVAKGLVQAGQEKGREKRGQVAPSQPARLPTWQAGSEGTYPHRQLQGWVGEGQVTGSGPQKHWQKEKAM